VVLISGESRLFSLKTLLIESWLGFEGKIMTQFEPPEKSIEVLKPQKIKEKSEVKSRQADKI